ncbi:MAG: 2-polyprenyl-3-methyl-6-methoxy-1,4-benzoquinone monooxygenase [Paucibacter sp.]|nr:2-polyprenyl-3-methyl-6-methoxy-1,4-benzoquinone monooxygenase [Roseateles sp.]
MPALPLSPLDRLVANLDQGLKTVFARAPVHPLDEVTTGSSSLSAESARLSGALMRVNHVGEVCAQALYQSQSLFSRSPELRAHFEQAAQDERAHLAWTRQRIEELGTHTSYLNPLWYAGAYAIGAAAGLAGDRVSLGFVVETERQVEQHLAGHLDRLPPEDETSRRIVARMKEDEARHAEEATAAGAMRLPPPLLQLMRLAARVMTRTAHYL